MKRDTKDQWYVGLSMWVWVIGTFLLVLLLLGATFGIKWVTADARGRGAAREQIKANGSFRIAAYNDFFNLCAGIQAQEDRIKIFQDDPSPNGQVNLRAVQAKRAELIREYNNKASREYTEGQFKDSDLPYRIDPTQEDTQCAA